MKALIYGGGAVGLGVASCLLKSSVEVTILAREKTVTHLKREGLQRTGIFGDVYAGPGAFTCAASLGEMTEGTFDVVLVCTKSSDSRCAAADLARYSVISDGTAPIVLFQNGWGNAEIFTEFFPAKRIYNARVITGFTRPRPNEVHITVHADAIHIGSLFGADTASIKPLCDAVAAGDIPCELTNEIEKDLWAKMLYNCALNPLGAILEVPYGALAADDATRQIMDRIVEEVYRVLEASGYQTHWPTADAFLKIFYERLVPPTAEHRSSTLQDLQANKQTEIDALSGAVIRLADQHIVAVPYNRSVYNMIRFLERRRTGL